MKYAVIEYPRIRWWTRYVRSTESGVLISLCHMAVKTIYNSNGNDREHPREPSIIGLFICYHCSRMLLITTDEHWRPMVTYVELIVYIYATSTRPCIKYACMPKLIKKPTYGSYFSLMKKHNFPLPFSWIVFYGWVYN